MLPHPFFLWVLRLSNHVGPAGSTVNKPVLTLPSHLLFHVPRNLFQEDLLHFFFQIWGPYFAFSLFSGSWTLFQSCDSQYSSWLFHAQLVLPVLVTCRSICASHLVGLSCTNVNKFSLTPSKNLSQLFVSCDITFAEDIIDPYESKGLIQRLPHFGVMWYMHSVSASGSWECLSSILRPLCTPFLWQQDLGCCFLFWTPEQAASPKTECFCLLLILLQGCLCGKWHRGIFCMCVVNLPPAGPVFCSSWYPLSGCSLWISKFDPD